MTNYWVQNMKTDFRFVVVESSFNCCIGDYLHPCHRILCLASFLP